MQLPERDDVTPTAVGMRIRFVRKFMQMNGMEFAKAIGQTPAVLSNWEKGRNRPTCDALLGIMRLVEVSSDFIYFGKEETLHGALYHEVQKSQQNSLIKKVSNG